MLNQLSQRAWATIDIGAIKRNLKSIREQVHQARILAVIKADAYGHGLENIAPNIWPEVDGFAVATINEGIRCRQLQSQRPVVVLSEFWHEQQLHDFELHSLDPVIHNMDQLPWLLGYRGSKLSVWIKFDTGMNRLGLNPESIVDVYAKLRANPSIADIRFISHLANADLVDNDYTSVQLEAFTRSIKGMTGEASLANSAGVMCWDSTVFDWVRPGLLLFGVSPCSSGASQLTLKPAMCLSARILSVKRINKGSPVGYGGNFITNRKTTIAMIGVGYGDGYPRVVDSKACVFVNGKRAPIVGNISMDIITIDITDIGMVSMGDVVELWGNQLAVEEVAGWAGTIPYELLCKVTPRIPRILVDHQSDV